MTESKLSRARVEVGLNRAVHSHHLVDLLAEAGIECVIDVGAHIGEFGKLLRGVGYDGTIVSLEPVSTAYAELEAACAADASWSARRLALGDRTGTAAIKVTRSSEFSSFKEPTAYGGTSIPEMEIEREETVDLRTLDDVLDELIPRPDPRLFLKIDTQASEREVLEGAQRSLPRFAALQIEVPLKPIYEGAAGYEELISRLNDRGFELTGIFPVTRDERLRLIEVDCVMIRDPGRPGEAR